VGQSGPAFPTVSVSDEEALEIGRRIWKNECGGSVEGLASWNYGEGFASMGIGHFIWYPEGPKGPFVECFPRLLAYLQASGVSLPAWLVPGMPCPWGDRRAFLAARSSPRMAELRGLLASTVLQQARFIIERLEASLPRMLASLSEPERSVVSRNFYAVAACPAGVFALADYLDFKGEGIDPAERYDGEGWGLLQALQGMRPAPAGASAVREFSESAARVLRRRVENSPPARGEARWLPGWLSRTAAYSGA
jgi:hypothetical protein